MAYQMGARRPNAMRVGRFSQSGTRIGGTLEQVPDLNAPAVSGQIYEAYNTPNRQLTVGEQVDAVNQVYVQQWFAGANVNWVYADANAVLYQYSYPASVGSFINPAIVMAVLEIIALLIAVIPSIIWAYIAYRVISAVPSGDWDLIVKGLLLIGGVFVSAELIRAWRGR